MSKKRILACVAGFIFLGCILLVAIHKPANPEVPLLTFAYEPLNPASSSFKYLAFQFFTLPPNSHLAGNNLPLPTISIDQQVASMVDAIGTTGSDNRVLAFVVGPLTFDHTDQGISDLIDESFQSAEKHDVAVAFHIDDSMFWELDTALNTKDNIEWTDWNGSPYSGRELDWSSTPTKISPQLCLNSPAVVQAVRARATLIAKDIAKNIAVLRQENKAYLFAGVISGWETQIGKDFDTKIEGGYCALENAGYSSTSSIDIDQARAAVVQQFIDLWSQTLASNGIPANKIYSHIAIDQISSPVETAFGDDHNPGFSTYPETDMKSIYTALSKNGNPPWASSEGSPLDPARADFGVGSDAMKSYLAGLFDHGATLVNIYGWNVGEKGNPFQESAQGNAAINAYREFFAGNQTSESQ